MCKVTRDESIVFVGVEFGDVIDILQHIHILCERYYMIVVI